MQVMVIAAALYATRRIDRWGGRLLLGLAAGLGTWLCLKFLGGFLSYVLPVGQIEFWLASKVCSYSALICKFGG